MSDEKNEGALTTVASIIPEAAYDIVARLLPGLVTLGAGFYLYNCFRFWILQQPVRWIVFGKDDPILGLIFLWGILCWTLGFILNPVGDIFSNRLGKPRIFCKLAETYRKVFLLAEQQLIIRHRYGPEIWEATTDEIEEQRALIFDELYQQVHEHLKDSRPDWRRLLLKIQAEMMFYANVLAGLSIVLLGGIILVCLAFAAQPIRRHTLGAAPVCGWLICSLAPILLTGAISWRELKDKYRQLWVRQLALLVADLQGSQAALLRPLAIEGPTG